MRFINTTCLAFVWILGTAAGFAQEARDAAVSGAPSVASQAHGPTASAPATETVPTEAERLTRLQRAVEDGEKQLKELRAKIDDPESEFAQAEADFKTVDGQLEAEKKKLEEAEKAGQAEEVESLKTKVADLEKQRKLARDRFDLAIQERKVIQEQAANLEQKLKQDQAALEKLLAPPASQPAGPDAAAPTSAPAPAVVKPAEPGTTAVVTPAGPVSPEAATAEEKPAADVTEEKKQEKPPSKELVEAKQELQTKVQETEAAEEQVRTVTERITQIEKAIAAQKKLVDAARAKAENARESERSLTEQVQRQSAEGAPLAERQVTWGKIRDARERQGEAEKQVEEQLGRLEELREELGQLQAEQIQALSEAEAKREELARSQKKVEQIENPFSPRNMLQWAVVNGPKVLGIVVAVFVLLWCTNFLTRRITILITKRAEHGSRVDQEQRAKTLADVFHSTTNTIIVTGGVIMVLDVLGVPVAPLLGGAAVVGLAVAFGAQNLIRDYFSGFIILLENQYTVNDVVKICGIGGLVERVTLRVTVLRDLEGVAHFIPNGQITTVSNMTHQWSRALFEIGVAYKEDADYVMQVLMELTREARQDPRVGPHILADAEMLGVDELGDSAVVIKFFMKTRPLQQWAVKREMLRRIKKRFDELGIEIPFPHRTIYHRTEDQTALDSPIGPLRGD